MNYKKLLFILIAVLLLSLGLWYYRSSSAQRLVSGVIKNPAENLRSSAGRINILLLGIGGLGHEGSNLTDSMILVSLNNSTYLPTLISIPRDIWLHSLAAKINTAYYYGEEKSPGLGLDLAKASVAELTGLEIHYVVVLDFDGFVKAIDIVGGLDIVIDRTFDDYKYPIPGKENASPVSARYEHLHFDEGPTHLDGKTALKYVRSRHAQGEEGTDFARGQRQQKVLQSFRDRVFSTNTLYNIDTLSKLKENLTTSIKTNITEQEYGSFGKILLKLNQNRDFPSIDLEPLFINPSNTKPYDGQWVLVPKDNWEAVHAYVQENLAK